MLDRDCMSFQHRIFELHQLYLPQLFCYVRLNEGIICTTFHEQMLMFCTQHKQAIFEQAFDKLPSLISIPIVDKDDDEEPHLVLDLSQIPKEKHTLLFDYLGFILQHVLFLQSQTAKTVKQIVGCCHPHLQMKHVFIAVECRNGYMYVIDGDPSQPETQVQVDHLMNAFLNFKRLCQAGWHQLSVFQLSSSTSFVIDMHSKVNLIL